MTSLHPAPPRHRRPVQPLRVAMLGAAGPADARPQLLDEVAHRLVRHGHDVTVYSPTDPAEHRGVRWVHVPPSGVE